jgi:hypothetical protein
MKLKFHARAALLLSLAGSCVLVPNIQAQFSYQSRDLMLTFRKTGFDGGSLGTVVIQVDIGQASLYYGATPGSSIPITSYSPGTQLGLFDDLNDLSWSIGGCVPNAGDSGDASKPSRTLWLTAPRSDPNTAATPWTRQSSYTQGTTDSHILAVLVNAQTWASATPADSVTNTATVAAIPTTSGDNAGGSLGALGNYLGTFQGDVENTTPSDFTIVGAPSRSDFYELQPDSTQTSPPGTHLGYFELGTNGSLTFYALSTQQYPQPTLSASSDGAGNLFVSFPSTANGTYSLHYTNSAGLTAPVSTWATVSTNIVGDGTVKSFQQPISGPGFFYTVSVH